MRVLLFIALIATLVGSNWGFAEGNEAHAQPGSTSVAEPETVAVARRGILYLFGNRLEPPFVFTIYNDTLWVNDYYFMGKPGPKPRREVSEIHRRRHELNVRVHEEMDSLRVLKVGKDSLFARAAEIYGGSDLVDSVKVVLDGLWLWWRGDTLGPEHVSISEYIPPKPPFVERLRSEARLLAGLLQQGHIELRGRCSLGSRRAGEIDEQIRRMRERGWATPEEEIKFQAYRGGVEELLNPRPLKRRGEKR